MTPKLKPLREQVLVVTGATSGIGLATARMACQAGAAVVLCARNPDALRRVEADLVAAGGRAAHHAADVADRPAVERVAALAVERFGGFDTWVNNAGVDLWGKLEDIPDADARRLWDTNFWGLVNGSVVAVRHLRTRGGVLVNVGSVLGDVAVPVQGLYAASKFAVRGFTDALRQELLMDGAPVAVTLVKPSSMDTPVPQHARNLTGREPAVPPPVYRPEETAAAILHAAEHGPRDVTVGLGGRLYSGLARHLPETVDWLNARVTSRTMFRAGPARHPAGNLYQPGPGGAVRGSHPGVVLPASVYTRAGRHPLLAAGLAVGAGLVAAGLLARNRGGGDL